MNKTKVEFTWSAMGGINAHLDAIQDMCQKGLSGESARSAIQDVQSEVYALRQFIKQQGVIVHPNAANAAA